MFGSRAQPGSGGLSINTASANALGPNSSSQPPKSGGLFGSLQQPKPMGNIFGSSVPASQATGNTLFGAANSNSGGNLFGPTTTASQSQSNSLFSTSSATQGGGLFGPPLAAAQPQQSNSLFSGGLFGTQGSNNQQNQGPGSSAAQQGGSIGTTLQQGAGLFGSLGQTQNQTSEPRSNSMFGGGGSQPKATSLFSSGSTMTQNQTQSQTQPQTHSVPSIFTNSIGQLSQQQQTVPGVRLSVNELRPTTRFNDLHEELQKSIENIDNFILDQMRFQNQCESAIQHVHDASVLLPDEVENGQMALDAVQQALENDAQAVLEVKKLSKADASNTKLSFNAVSALRLPQQLQRSSAWYSSGTPQLIAPSLIDDDVEGAATNLISYFSTQADEMSKTLDGYRGRIGEIESYLGGLEVGIVNGLQQLMFVRGQDGSSKSVEDQVKELAAVLREMESGISGVAGKVTGTREKVEEVVLNDGGNSRSWRYSRS